MAEDSDNTCYNGAKLQEWKNAVTIINDSHVNLFPKILEKGSQGNWKKVKQSQENGQLQQARYTTSHRVCPCF